MKSSKNGIWRYVEVYACKPFSKYDLFNVYMRSFYKLFRNIFFLKFSFVLYSGIVCFEGEAVLYIAGCGTRSFGSDHYMSVAFGHIHVQTQKQTINGKQVFLDPMIVALPGIGEHGGKSALVENH